MLKFLPALCVAAGLVIAGTAPRRQPEIDEELRLPISLDADATDYDGKNSMLMFRGLRLTQGNIGIEADFGRASKLDFEDSVWQFSGDVTIDTGSGHIECATADLRFAGHQLQVATITGSPATFELRRPGSDEVTYAEAGRLEYDFPAGIIEFSEDATITEGGNRISSNYLVYNIRERRINAQSDGNEGDKVKVIYTPGATDDDEADEEEPPPANDQSGQDDEAAGDDDS
ncbi:MAG: LptA/OstA family protein [Woeseiaceae bacterium]|nr:LptA/OstA family protein [Woeseiaceae bacterium]